MAGPNDYTIQQPDIAGSLMGGIAAGQKLGAQQAAQDKAEMYAADLQSYLQNPTARGASAMMAKYPESQKAMSASFETYNKGQKEDIFKAGTQAYSAIQNGKPEVAMSILDERIAAAENSGQDTADLQSLKQSLSQDPQSAGAGLALTMSALNPDAWSKIAGEMRDAAKAPAEQSLAEAKASKAATDAKFAESAAVQDLQKGGWEISKLQNDIGISRQNAQIAAMNAATSREGNSIKKQELQLKLQDKIDARDAKVNEKAAEVTSARSTIDNMLNTADRVLQTPIDVIDDVTGPINSKLPTVGGPEADFEELVNTLSSQAFMAQIPALKGMGALSNAEGEKLQSSLQNLSLRQSKEQLMTNVKEAQRLILKSRANLSSKYGVPDVVPDTPAAAPSPTNIDALLQKYGGQ
jgi:hypothetical protein